jgi:hydroxypyruvate reductase
MPGQCLSPESAIVVFEGAAHNLPDAAAEAAAAAVLALVAGARATDLVLVLISGGGSALLPLPVPGVSLADKLATTQLLAHRGATIHELNTVRKHLSCVKGGRLAAACKASLVTLVLSDVVGNPLDVIASGPTVPDGLRVVCVGFPFSFLGRVVFFKNGGFAAESTFDDCFAIFHRLHIDADIDIPPAVVRHLRAGAAHAIPANPRANDPAFERTHTLLVGSNAVAVRAAVAKAQIFGFTVVELGCTLTGEARVLGKELVATVRRQVTERGPGRWCFLGAGETTVKLCGNGLGGRNQVRTVCLCVFASTSLTHTHVDNRNWHWRRSWSSKGNRDTCCLAPARTARWLPMSVEVFASKKPGY